MVSFQNTRIEGSVRLHIVLCYCSIQIVGTECSAHRKKKDVVGQAHQEADKIEKGIVMQKKDIVTKL